MRMTTALVHPFRYEGVLSAFGCPPRAAQITYSYVCGHPLAAGGRP